MTHPISDGSGESALWNLPPLFGILLFAVATSLLTKASSSNDALASSLRFLCFDFGSVFVSVAGGVSVANCGTVYKD